LKIEIGLYASFIHPYRIGVTEFPGAKSRPKPENTTLLGGDFMEEPAVADMAKTAAFTFQRRGTVI